MSIVHETSSDKRLLGQRVGFVGRLTGMSKREAGRIVREQGGVALDKLDLSANLLVVGDDQSVDRLLTVVEAQCDEDLVGAVRQGKIELLSENEFWQQLGMVDAQQDVRRLYTPAMLAEFLHVPVGVVRRWHRRGLIESVREVRRLPYFSFQEVSVARLLSELIHAGCSLGAIERRLAEIDRMLPEVSRPLVSMPFVVEGKQLLLRQGEDLTELGGQLRIDFGSIEENLAEGQQDSDPARVEDPQLETFSTPVQVEGEHAGTSLPPTTPDEMVNLAGEMETEGQLDDAIEMYRAALVAGGATAETNFLLAEVLYRRGDLFAARERYYCTLELDEDYVEARANLGCVLAETNEHELAVAAFEGTLICHPDYPDVHYHLARTLHELDRTDEAMIHWQAFLAHAPDSPWADEARAQLADRPV